MTTLVLSNQPEPDVLKRSLKTMMKRNAKENAAGLRRICKRSDQPKIERLVNNDARLILLGKLNGATTR